jgi:hypothetical protein
MQMARGGWTALVGIFLVMTGVVATFVGVASVSQALMLQVYDSWIPMTPAALDALYLLAIAAPIAAGVGGGLIGIARAERDREEESLLDPLRYRPVRGPWRRGTPLLIGVVLITGVPGLFWVPVAHSLSFSVPVADCSTDAQATVFVTLPQFAVLTYSWHSDDGRAVSLVRMPSGPNVTSLAPSPLNFTRSSSGWSAFESNGSAMPFFACEEPGVAGPSAPTSITVTGTYYVRLL